MTLPSLDEAVETFDLLEDWEERYRYLIELGRTLPPLEEAERVEANKVRGCTSQVWLIAEPNSADPDRLVLRGESDAHIVQGLVALLLAAYSGRRRQEIAETDIAGLFAQLGLSEHLSPNRRNGFFAMVERIHALAGLDRVQARG